LEQPRSVKPGKTRMSDPNPVYNVNSTALGRHRRKAREGLGTLSRAERVAYADAVESAVRASQAASLNRLTPLCKPLCASGTWHSCGKAIHAAVKARQRAALLAYPSQVRKARTDAQWLALYAQAMNEKRQAVQPRD
jgi:hypothetical protein